MTAGTLGICFLLLMVGLPVGLAVRGELDWPLVAVLTPAFIVSAMAERLLPPLLGQRLSPKVTGALSLGAALLLFLGAYTGLAWLSGFLRPIEVARQNPWLSFIGAGLAANLISKLMLKLLFKRFRCAQDRQMDGC